MKAGVPEIGLVVGAPNVPPWKVVAVDGDSVSYECSGRRHTVSASTWKRNVEARSLRKIDAEPPAEPVAASQPASAAREWPALSARDAAALAAVHDLAGPDGWARPRCTGVYLDRSGLSRTSWRRAVESLEQLGAVEVETVSAALGRPSQIRPLMPRPTLATTLASGQGGQGGWPGLARGGGQALRESDKSFEEKNKDTHTLSPVPWPPLASGKGGGHGVARVGGQGGWPGCLTVPLPEDAAASARVLRAVADALEAISHGSRTDLAPVSHDPAPAPVGPPVVVAPVAPQPLPPVAAPRPTPATVTDHRATLGRVVEVWTYELQLPASRATGCESTWASLHSDGRPVPTVEAVVAALKREAPKWHSKASEEKRKGETDPWKWTPKLRNWLASRSWEAGPDPVPRDGGAVPKVELGPEAKARIEELRKKAETHERIGDHAMARDYRRQVDQIKATGRIP